MQNCDRIPRPLLGSQNFFCLRRADSKKTFSEKLRFRRSSNFTPLIFTALSKSKLQRWPKLHENLLQQLEESRKHTDTDLVLLHFEKLEDTKRVQNCWSANFLSKDWSEKLRKILNLTFDSKPLPLWHFKKQLKHI